MTYKCGISIVISTYNGERKIRNTLEALAKLDTTGIPAVELIVVDNASTDQTAGSTLKIWESLGQPFPLLLLHEATPGKLNAQEKGFQHVSYAYVITCDDDNSFFSNYLQVGYKLLSENKKIGVLGGKGILKSQGAIPDWIKEESYFFACGPQAKQTGPVYGTRNVVYGAGMWIRMEAYAMAKSTGFEFVLKSRTGKQMITGAEDSELCWALRFLGYDIWYVDDLNFSHWIPKERLTKNYTDRLKKGFKENGPLGNLYLRVWKKEINSTVHWFWFKELSYTILYLFKILIQHPKGTAKQFEIRRILINIKYFLVNRGKYDTAVNQILQYRKKGKQAMLGQ
jgi:glycosyltransferase involved in cell wall biosynthesis